MVNSPGLTGQKGEDAVAACLSARGWEIVARNWRHGRLEIDLICRDADSIVFVEVKTRSSGGMTTGADAFTPRKQSNLLRAAKFWLSRNRAWDKPCRFDLVLVDFNGGQYETELIPNVIQLDQPRPARPGGDTTWQPW